MSFGAIFDGTLESNVILNNGGHTNFYLQNADFRDGFEMSVIKRPVYDDFDYWFLSKDNGFTTFSYFYEKLQEPEVILNFFNIIEDISFNDPSKNLVVELHHVHKGIDDTVQTLNIDYAHKDDKYSIIHDEKGDFKIVKK